MDRRSNPAIFLGVDRLLGLQLARILWRHGIPTFGVAIDPDSHHCRTRALRRIVPMRAFQDDPVRHLSELETEYGARPVLIPCLDELVWWLNDHRASLAEHADFLLPPTETLERLGDKGRFYDCAVQNDLDPPPTRIVDRRDDLESSAAALGFPLMIKPPRRSAAWMEATSGSKVLRVEDATSLQRVAAPLFDVVDELVLQTWVEGGDDCMYSLFVCLDRDSIPVVPSLVARKIRQWPPDIGVGSLVVETREDELVEKGLRLLQRVGYMGPGSLQFKRDAARGTFHVIEMNTRAALSFPLFEACGVEATLAHYCLAAGLPLPEQRLLVRPGGRWICWKRDLASAYAHWRRGDLTLRGWLASLRGPKRSADVVLNDPVPLLVDAGRKLGRTLSRSR